MHECHFLCETCMTEDFGRSVHDCEHMGLWNRRAFCMSMSAQRKVYDRMRAGVPGRTLRMTWLQRLGPQVEKPKPAPKLESQKLTLAAPPRTATQGTFQAKKPAPAPSKAAPAGTSVACCVLNYQRLRRWKRLGFHQRRILSSLWR